MKYWLKRHWLALAYKLHLLHLAEEPDDDPKNFYHL